MKNEKIWQIKNDKSMRLFCQQKNANVCEFFSWQYKSVSFLLSLRFCKKKTLNNYI